MQVQRGNGSIALLVLQLGCTLAWLVNVSLRPLWPRERDPVHIVKEFGRASDLVWTGNENRNFVTHTDLELQTIQSVAHHHTGYTILDHFVAKWASVKTLSTIQCREVSRSDSPTSNLQLQHSPLSAVRDPLYNKCSFPNIILANYNNKLCALKYICNRIK